MNQRRQTPPRDKREAPPSSSPHRPPPPPPHGHAEQRGCGLRVQARGQGSLHMRTGRRGPSGTRPGQRDPPPPRPASARSLGMGTCRPRPRAHTAPGSGRTHAAHAAEAQHPGLSKTLDSASGSGRREEGALGCPPGGAAGAGAALTPLCRRFASSARCAPAPAAAAPLSGLAA